MTENSKSMVKMGRGVLALLVLCYALSGSGAKPAMASDLGSFNVSVATAMEPYRNASAYLRTGNQDLAALELEAAIEAWQATLDRFATSPPDAFIDDPSWRATLEEVGTGLQAALTDIDAGNREAAASALAPTRNILADLRRRNGVITFSDRVNAVSDAMAALLPFRKGSLDLEDAATLKEMRSRTAVLAHEMARCRAAASDELKSNPAYSRLVEGAAAALERLWRGIEEKDVRLTQGTLSELRSFERILYLRFG